MKFQNVLAGLTLTVAALGAEIQEVMDDIGANPTLVNLWTYVPDELRDPMPAIVIAVGTWGVEDPIFQYWYQPLVEAADKAGDFIILFPIASRERYLDRVNCWDTPNPGTLTHGGVGDTTGILSAVRWALDKYSGDPARVFVVGLSSGAQMAITLAATYPEVFGAVAAYSGVPFACMFGLQGEPSPWNWNSSCGRHELLHSPEEWAGFVRNAYPGYNGPYPRMAILFGGDDIELKMPEVGYDTLAQWATVMQVENVANLTGPLVDQGPDFTELVYGDGTKLVGYFGHHGVGHFVPLVPSVLLRWFGLGGPEIW